METKFRGFRETTLNPDFVKDNEDKELMISIEPKGIIIGSPRNYRYLQFRGFDGSLYYYESNDYKRHYDREKYFASGNSKT